MVYLPLWKIWVRQLELWNSQCIKSHKSHVPNHQLDHHHYTILYPSLYHIIPIIILYYIILSNTSRPIWGFLDWFQGTVLAASTASTLRRLQRRHQQHQQVPWETTETTERLGKRVETVIMSYMFIPIGSMVLSYMVTWIPSIYPKC